MIVDVRCDPNSGRKQSRPADQLSSMPLSGTARQYLVETYEAVEHAEQDDRA